MWIDSYLYFIFIIANIESQTRKIYKELKLFIFIFNIYHCQYWKSNIANIENQTWGIQKKYSRKEFPLGTVKLPWTLLVPKMSVSIYQYLYLPMFTNIVSIYEYIPTLKLIGVVDIVDIMGIIWMFEEDPQIGERTCEKRGCYNSIEAI